jgi:hydroxyethylthiazole kinase
MTEKENAEKTAELLGRIRKQKPLIHHITNFVVMNSTANVTLAIGASPIMSHAHEEMEDIQSFASALNLNIGTLTDYWIESMIKAGKAAEKNETPIILDPVGSGATSLRTDAAKKIIDSVPVKVIRGNASEVMSLSGDDFKIKGVDSLESVDAARDGARRVALKLGKVLAITGKIDFVTDGERNFEIHNGHEMFGNVTGTGCAATTAISCFNAVEEDAVVATAAALGYFGLAGEIAAKNSTGPGSFQAALYDALFTMKDEDIIGGVKIKQI